MFLHFCTDTVTCVIGSHTTQGQLIGNMHSGLLECVCLPEMHTADCLRRPQNHGAQALLLPEKLCLRTHTAERPVESEAWGTPACLQMLAMRHRDLARQEQHLQPVDLLLAVRHILLLMLFLVTHALQHSISGVELLLLLK